YLRAAGGQIPELKRVIVAYQNNIVMEETLDAALDKIFPGGSTPTETVPGPLPSQPSSATGTPAAAQAPAAADAGTLAGQARGHYLRALQAQRDGNWALYGEEIRKLGDVLEKMKR
ncbi:MAG TPA: hypothetical protein VNJ03_00745, partial [Vicinamibacterales bacterium]|nr:hypothetical protein [Vicinamibacterales bacterium]